MENGRSNSNCTWILSCCFSVCGFWFPSQYFCSQPYLNVNQVNSGIQIYIFLNIWREKNVACSIVLCFNANQDMWLYTYLHEQYLEDFLNLKAERDKVFLGKGLVGGEYTEPVAMVYPGVAVEKRGVVPVPVLKRKCLVDEREKKRRNICSMFALCREYWYPFNKDSQWWLI